MNDRLYRPFLPGVSQLVQAVANDLVSGKSVLLLMPDTADSDGISDQCIDCIQDAGLLVEQIDLDADSGSEDPLELLRTEFFWDAAAKARIHSLHDLMNSGITGVIVLNGLDQLSEQARQSWRLFFVQWSDLAHSAVDLSMQPAALFACHKARPGEQCPLESPRLRIHWAWRFVTALDSQIAVRWTHDGNGLCLDAESSWRESLIPALAGGDIRLGRALWDAVLLPTEQIIASLCAYASACGWTSVRLKALQIEEYLQNLASRGARLTEPRAGPERDLWALGVLNLTPEDGLTISSAALALLGQTDLLRHRIWRGQARLVLPEIDLKRVEVCRHLLRLVDTLWITRWADLPPEETDDLLQEPLSAEWGQLARAIRLAPWEYQRRLPNIHELRRIRNLLAHYAPITFRDYCVVRNTLF